MIKRYLLTHHHGFASEFRAVGEPFCDKINLRRDGVITADGKDVAWSPWQEIGREIPSEAIMVDMVTESF